MWPQTGTSAAGGLRNAVLVPDRCADEQCSEVAGTLLQRWARLESDGYLRPVALHSYFHAVWPAMPFARLFHCLVMQ